MARHDRRDDPRPDDPRVAWGTDSHGADAPVLRDVFRSGGDGNPHLLVIGQPTTGKSALSWTWLLRAAGDDAPPLEDGGCDP